jgi:hypothetical protein
MIIKHLYAVLMLLTAFSTRAVDQINKSDTLLLQYNTAISGNLQTGNLEAAALRLALKCSIRTTFRRTGQQLSRQAEV